VSQVSSSQTQSLAEVDCDEAVVWDSKVQLLHVDALKASFQVPTGQGEHAVCFSVLLK